MTHRLSYLWRGLLYGVLAGLVAAEIYIVFITAVWLVTKGFSIAASSFILAHIIGVIPTIIVGGISGLLIGFVFTLIRRNINAKTGSILGFGITSLLMFLMFFGLIVAQSSVIESWQIDLRGFVTLVLPALLLFLASGAWGGRKLVMSMQPHVKDKTNLNPEQTQSS